MTRDGSPKGPQGSWKETEMGRVGQGPALSLLHLSGQGSKVSAPPYPPSWPRVDDDTGPECTCLPVKEAVFKAPFYSLLAVM